ncbi:MAG: hypothetical protein C0403_10520, partial [Desulfobacterium sp.]|nr:hypothetical protein [Desulfobacterium sp.]
MISFDLLKQIHVFKDFTDDQLALITACASEDEFKRGDCLFMKGKDSTHLWIVLEGHVNLDFEVSGNSISKRDMISFASKTNVFGWTCFVAPYQYR